jgi:hypothetical protein
MDLRSALSALDTALGPNDGNRRTRGGKRASTRAQDKRTGRPSPPPTHTVGQRLPMRDRRWVRRTDGAVVQISAGPLHFDKSVRRKWMQRVRDARLPAGAVAFAASIISDRSDDAGKTIWGAQEKMAEQLGRCQRTVQHDIAALEGAGLVVVERCKPYRQEDGTYRRRWSNRYFLVVDLRDHGKYHRYFAGLFAPTPAAPPKATSTADETLPATTDGTVPEVAHGPPTEGQEPVADPVAQLRSIRDLLPERHGQRREKR